MIQKLQRVFPLGLLLALAVVPHAALAQKSISWNGTVSDQTFTVGAAASLTLPGVTGSGPNCGNYVNYTLTPTLPAGLSFAGGSNSTRVLSGTPTTETAQAQYTYQAYDQSCYLTITQTFNITVAAAPDIQLSKSRAELTEGGDTTYTVRLKNEPTGDVTVTVASGDTGAVTASPPSLTFTMGNYDIVQTVTLTGQQDADGVDESVTVTNTASGGGLNGKVSSLVAVVTDDDKGITLSTTSLTLTKGQAGKSYMVMLAAAPNGDVSVSIDKQGEANVTLNPTSLTFTSTSWNTPQTVTASPSSTLDGFNRSATLRHSASGGGYGTNTPVVSLAVLAEDPNNPGLNVSPNSLSLTEGGGTGTFTVKLGHASSATVDLTVTSGDLGAATAHPAAFTILSQNWNVGQTITVTPVDDTDSNNESVTLTVAADRGGYDGETATVTVTIADNAVTLTAGAVTPHSATLTIAGRTAAWWYKGNQSGAQCTSVAQNTASANLSGLTPKVSYVYKAYSDSSCSMELTSAATDAEFSTKSGKVKDLRVTAGNASLDVNWAAQSGATGYAIQWKSGSQDWDAANRQVTTTNSSSVTLSSELVNGTDYVVRVAAQFTSPYGVWSDAATGKPTASPSPLTASAITSTGATLTLGGHTGDWWVKGSGGGGYNLACARVSTPTHSLADLSANRSYEFAAYSGSACADANKLGAVGFTTPGSLSLAVHDVRANSAYVELHGFSGRAPNWSHRIDTLGDARAGPCRNHTRGASVHLSLRPGTNYTAHGFNGLGCADLERFGSVTFATPSNDSEKPQLSVSNIGDNGATLTLSNHTGDWWYDRGRNAGTCTAVPAGTTTATLSGLSPNTTYFFTAYSDPRCAATDESIAWESMRSFTTTGSVAIAVSAKTATGFTVTLSGYTQEAGYPRLWAVNAARKLGDGGWDVSRCQVKAHSETSAVITGLQAGQTYSINIYKRNTCNFHTDVISASATTTSLSGGGGNANSASLTLNHHDGAWSYRGGAVASQTSASTSASASAQVSGVAAAALVSGPGAETARGAPGPVSGVAAAAWSAPGRVSGVTTAAAHSAEQCHAMPAGTYTANLDGLSAETRYAFTAWAGTSCAGAELGRTSFTTPAPGEEPDDEPAAVSLAASALSATSARLRIANHAGAWWYRLDGAGGADAADSSACAAAGGAEARVSGLAPGASHGFTAYSAADCGADSLLASASALTPALAENTLAGLPAGSASLRPDLLSDLDGDGVTDFVEALRGTDPLAAASVDLSESVLDVLVLTTSQAAAHAGDGELKRLVEDRVDYANAAFAASGVRLRLRAALAELPATDYSPANTGNSQAGTDNSPVEPDNAGNSPAGTGNSPPNSPAAETDNAPLALLAAVAAGDAPAHVELRALRARLGADLVVFAGLAAEAGGSCGMAYQNGADGVFGAAARAGGWSWLGLDCAAHWLARGVGHNLGLAHARGHGGVFDFSAGHGAEGQFATIMADPAWWGVAEDQRLPLFSNPDLDCGGQACGVGAETGAGADAARSLNITGPLAAEWFLPQWPWPNALPASPAAGLTGAVEARIALGALSGGLYRNELRVGDVMDLVAEIEPDPRHLGLAADFHLLVRDQSGQIAQFGADGRVAAWDETLDGLVPLRSLESLAAVERFYVVRGLTIDAALAGLEWEMFLAYGAAGELVHAAEPLRLRVAD